MGVCNINIYIYITNLKLGGKEKELLEQGKPLQFSSSIYERSVHFHLTSPSPPSHPPPFIDHICFYRNFAQKKTILRQLKPV